MSYNAPFCMKAIYEFYYHSGYDIEIGFHNRMVSDVQVSQSTEMFLKSHSHELHPIAVQFHCANCSSSSKYSDVLYFSFFVCHLSLEADKHSRNLQTIRNWEYQFYCIIIRKLLLPLNYSLNGNILGVKTVHHHNHESINNFNKV